MRSMDLRKATACTIGSIYIYTSISLPWLVLYHWWS